MTKRTLPEVEPTIVTTPACNVVEMRRPLIRVTASGLTDERGAGAYLGCSARTLQRMRQQRRGPVYRDMHGRIWYALADLDEYLRDAAVDPLAS